MRVGKATMHKGDCQRVWKRYDVTCPRCQELIAGAPARDGWQKEYYERNAREDAREAQAVRDHFTSQKHLSGGCGPVCTFGQW